MSGGRIPLDYFQPAGIFPEPVPVEIDTDGKEPVDKTFVRHTMVNILEGFNPGILEKVVRLAAVSRQLTAKGIKRLFIAVDKDIQQLKLSGLAARDYSTIIQHVNYLYIFLRASGKWVHKNFFV